MHVDGESISGELIEITERDGTRYGVVKYDDAEPAELLFASLRVTEQPAEPPKSDKPKSSKPKSDKPAS